ncbi:MAG: PASTA domain-containing protein [Actinomycetota bacterium]
MRWLLCSAVMTMAMVAAACADADDDPAPAGDATTSTTSTTSTTTTVLPAAADEVVIVPDVTKRSQADAARHLQGLGLIVEVVDVPVDSRSEEVGHVVSQRPPGSTLVGPGSVVTVTVGQPSAWQGMCDHLEPFLGGENGVATPLDGWPVGDADLLVTNGFAVWGIVGDVATDPLLVFAGNQPVFTDGAGGVVLQDAFGVLRVREDGSWLRLIEDEDGPGWPGAVLSRTSQIDGSWYALATVSASFAPSEDGVGDLVMVPIDGGDPQIVRQVIYEETGAGVVVDGGTFIGDWGSLGDEWITGWDRNGAPVDLPWNRWSQQQEWLDETQVVGAHAGEVVVGVKTFEGGFSATVFDSFTGTERWSLEPVELGMDVRVREVTPYDGELLVSADTPLGPCTRVFAPDGAVRDLPVRGWATPVS